MSQGLPDGEFYYEVVDPATQQPVALLHLAWPEGLQPGYIQPVALLISEEKATEEAANQAGFRFFIDVESFKRYVQSEVLATTLAAD